MARQFEAPAASGSGEPNLVVAPDGRVLLSLDRARRGGRAQPALAARAEGRRVVRAPDHRARHRLVRELGGLPIRWPPARRHPLRPLAREERTGHLRLRRPRDRFPRRRQDLESPGDPHRDGTLAEHGFVSMTRQDGPDDGLRLARRTQDPGASHDGHGEGRPRCPSCIDTRRRGTPGAGDRS